MTVAAFALAQQAMPPEVKPETQSMAAIRELEKRLDERREADNKAIDQRFIYMEKAVEKADQSLDERLKGYPEIFGLKDSVESGSQRIRDLEDYVNTLQGRLWALGIAMALLMPLLSLAMNFFMRRRPDPPPPQHNGPRRDDILKK